MKQVIIKGSGQMFDTIAKEMLLKAERHGFEASLQAVEDKKTTVRKAKPKKEVE